IPSRATPPKPEPLTRISSRAGKTPIRTFRSSSRRKRNTPSCSRPLIYVCHRERSEASGERSRAIPWHPDVTTGTDRNSNLFAKQAKGVRGTAVARLSLAAIEPVFLTLVIPTPSAAQAGGTCFFANSAQKSGGL